MFAKLERFKIYESYPKRSKTRRKMKIWFSRRYLATILKHNKTLECHYCGRKRLKIQWDNDKIPAKLKATIDHITPISKGGKVFCVTNLVVACEHCNQKKGVIPYQEFVNLIKKLKKHY